MLNAVAGAWPVDSGKIIIGGTDVDVYKRQCNMRSNQYFSKN